METKNLLNKKITQWLLLVAMLVGCSASAFGTDFDNNNTRMSGIRVKYTKDGGSETQAYYKINDTTNSWENGDCKMTIPNTSFGGVNFGNIKSLYLTEGWLNARVTGCGNGCNDYAEARFSYKVWKSGGSEPGSYTNAFTANTWCGGSRWDGASDMTITVTGQNVNVTSGLSSGTYNLKVKMEMQARWSGGTFGDTYTYEKTATFTIPATCTDPTATQYPMTNATKTYGSVSAPTITPASGAGTVKTIYYTGVSPTSYSKSSTLPTNAGTYKVTVDVNAGSTYCAKNSIDLTGNFVINKATQSALTFNGSTQCVDTEVTLSATGGSTSETITYKVKSGTGTITNGKLTTSTAGDVVVTATRPGGTNYNDVTKDATFTFVAKPTAYAVSGTATICTGNSTNVTLANSQTGYTYKLYKGGSATSTTKTGTTGSALNFSVSEAGTYTVKGYVTGNESCTTDMTGSAVITVNQNMALTSISLSSASECIGGTSNITPNGWNLGGGSISYTSSNSSVASVSGTTITAKSAGTVTITGTVSGGCGSSVSKTASFKVKASNAISSISFTKSPLKVGETCTATAEYTTEDGTGSWSADGTYATITAGGVVTGKAIGTATITYTITGGCGGTVSKNATLEIITNCESPDAGSISGTTSICAGNGTTLTLSGQTAGTNLQWYKSTDGSSYSAVSGAKGTSLSTGTLNANAYYKVRVSRTDDASCYSETTPVTVTVTAIPTITTHTDNSRCGTGTVTLSATASAGDVKWYSASTSGTALKTGTSYTTPSISTTTTYYVDATQNGCTTASRTAVTATVKTVPSIGSISKSADECGAGNITFQANSVTAGATVTWYENSAPLAPTGTVYTFTDVPAGTSHTVKAKASKDGCESGFSSELTGTRKANPSLTVTAPSDAYGWENATFTVTGEGTITGSVTQTAGSGGIINDKTFKGHVNDTFRASYTATGDNGCTTQKSAEVTVEKATESCD